MDIPILNRTMELSDCREAWFFDARQGCWCLEDLLYTPVPQTPAFQRLSIYAPRNLLEGGRPASASKSVPVVFENNAAGYMQMPHTWPGGPRWGGQKFLEAGFVYVTCGCRGRESRDSQGVLVGKSPASLVDLKTALRFLRHNDAAIPGDLNKIISVGVSAGGAMSSLLGLTGDHGDYDADLQANGAFMDESDAVFAAQCYCPIIDLEHADLAYEWMFHRDRTCEDSHAGPQETMDDFRVALSGILARKYIAYFNALELPHPETGAPLGFNPDGRSGSGYDYLMDCLNAAAGKYLTLLDSGKLPQIYSAADYLRGSYTALVPAPAPRDAHHIGPGAPEGLPPAQTMGERLLRPPKGAALPRMERAMTAVPGTEKSSWLHWDGRTARIRDLDAYIAHHRRRMKPCTAFDTLAMNSGENQVLGTPEEDFLHFSPDIGDAIAQLRDRFPAEYDRYYPGYAAAAEDAGLKRRLRLYNPMDYIGTAAQGVQAKHFRIRVGSRDADTAPTIAMALALKLQKYHCGTVDYAIVWEQPHCDADYPGELYQWIKTICAG